MTYCNPNFKSKKELTEAVKAGCEVTVFEPGFFPKDFSGSCVAYLEGPHYPQPHKWYARVRVQDGKVIEVCK